MGNTDSKLNFRKAVIQLTTKTQVFIRVRVMLLNEGKHFFYFIFLGRDRTDERIRLFLLLCGRSITQETLNMYEEKNT